MLVQFGGGTLVTIAGQPDEAKARELDVNIARFSAQVNTELLNTFAQLIDDGKIKVFCWPLTRKLHTLQ